MHSAAHVGKSHGLPLRSQLPYEKFRHESGWALGLQVQTFVWRLGLRARLVLRSAWRSGSGGPSLISLLPRPSFSLAIRKCRMARPCALGCHTKVT